MRAKLIIAPSALPTGLRPRRLLLPGAARRPAFAALTARSPASDRRVSRAMRSRLFLKLDGTRARFFLPVSPSLMPGGVASDAGDLGLRPGPCGLCIFFFWSAPRRSAVFCSCLTCFVV